MELIDISFVHYMFVFDLFNLILISENLHVNEEDNLDELDVDIGFSVKV